MASGDYASMASGHDAPFSRLIRGSSVSRAAGPLRAPTTRMCSKHRQLLGVWQSMSMTAWQQVGTYVQTLFHERLEPRPRRAHLVVEARVLLPVEDQQELVAARSDVGREGNLWT